MPEETRRLIELSDEIALLSRQLRERIVAGLPDDPEEREHLAQLMDELERHEPHSQAAGAD